MGQCMYPFKVRWDTIIQVSSIGSEHGTVLYYYTEQIQGQIRVEDQYKFENIKLLRGYHSDSIGVEGQHTFENIKLLRR